MIIFQTTGWNKASTI